MTIDKNFKAITSAPIKSRFLFDERSTYASSVGGYFNAVNPNSIDLWYDVPFYGKVDTFGRLVTPKVELMTFSLGKTNLMAFDFVQDAFNDYIFFLKKLAAQGRTRLPIILNNFSLKSSFFDSKEGVELQTSQRLEAYNSILIRDNIKISTFDQYICNLNQSFAESDYKLTFFSIFSSNNVPLDATGLAFRFKLEDEDNDNLKNKYFNNPEFSKFINISANFGFRINKNSPSMIVVDLNSKPMIAKVGRKIKRYIRTNEPGRRTVETKIPGYLQNRFITNLETFFEKYYNKVIYESFDMYKKTIIEAYGNYEDNVSYLVDHGDTIVENSRDFKSVSNLRFTRTKGKLITIKPYIESVMQDKYNDYYFIKKFEYILKHEMNNSYNKKNYKSFKAKFDYMVKSKKPINDILDYMEDYYTPTKIYNPDTQSLSWRNKQKDLTTTKSHASIQFKEQPSLSKIVTEFLPDL